MFPNPVDPVGGAVAEVPSIEIAAQEQHKNDLLTVGGFELAHFLALLLTSLVHVSEVAGGFRLNKNRQVWKRGSLGLDDCIDWNIDGLPFRAFDFDVMSKCESAWLHLVEQFLLRVGLERVASVCQILLNEGKLPLLLRVADNRLGNGTA